MKSKIALLSIIILGLSIGLHAQKLMDDSFVQYNKNGINGVKIEWKEIEKDFGEIKQNVAVKAIFEFTNIGNQAVLITKVVPSCGCTAMDYSKAPILPGKSSTITALYDAKSKGAFNKSITVFTNDPAGEKKLIIKGKVL